MDLTCCTSLQLRDFIEGHAAARRGDPFEPAQTLHWREGWAFWFLAAPEREEAMAVMALH